MRYILMTSAVVVVGVGAYAVYNMPTDANVPAAMQEHAMALQQPLEMEEFATAMEEAASQALITAENAVGDAMEGIELPDIGELNAIEPAAGPAVLEPQIKGAALPSQTWQAEPVR